MKTIQISNKRVGHGEPTFIIAEVGINHNGSIELAKKLIDVASSAGCDAVKFQKRTIDVVYTLEELAKPRESIFGVTNGDLKYGLELGEREYREIDRYCKEKNILWFASCWDEESVDFIARFDSPAYKIASASLTDAELLRHTRSKGKPILLSTGMSTFEQVKKAVEILGTEDLVILHSNSTYPSQNDELNLAAIQKLQEEFTQVPIGYSGHERGVSTSVCAVALGACVIERHITLDRTMWGSDHAASLEPKGIESLVRDIRVFEMARGDRFKRIWASEIPLIHKLRRKDTLGILIDYQSLAIPTQKNTPLPRSLIESASTSFSGPNAISRPISILPIEPTERRTKKPVSTVPAPVAQPVQALIDNACTSAASAIGAFALHQDSHLLINGIATAMGETVRKGGKILVCGNGGSLSQAMHFAEELTGRFRIERKPIPAIALSDPTVLSCIANDFSYDYVFSRQIEALAQPKDLLLVLSTSGTSANIVHALTVARTMGLATIGLLGRNGGDAKPLCDIALVIPGEFADRIQEIHLLILHTLVEATETLLQAHHGTSVATPIIQDSREIPGLGSEYTPAPSLQDHP